MVIQRQQVTVEAFEAFIALPENAGRLFEYIGGETVEVVSNNYSSMIAATILFHIKLHLRDSGQKGYVTGADGGYIVLGDRYMPDVAYVSAAKQREPSHETWNPNPPDLAVEVLSPTDSATDVRIKRKSYQQAGVLYWEVYPGEKSIDVYAPGQPAKTLGMVDTLDGGTVLPGFVLAVKDLFAE